MPPLSAGSGSTKLTEDLFPSLMFFFSFLLQVESRFSSFFLFGQNIKCNIMTGMMNAYRDVEYYRSFTFRHPRALNIQSCLKVFPSLEKKLWRAFCLSTCARIVCDFYCCYLRRQQTSSVLGINLADVFHSAIIFAHRRFFRKLRCSNIAYFFSFLRLSEKTQEARRVLLSDINFTSMVPELSRSADHLCQQKINEEADEDGDYFKGTLLKTPDYTRGITPSASMIASPGVSQWTVNESTTQTEAFWHDRGDSFDSSKSYSLRSGHSMNVLSKHQRSRSVPSIRCAVCKQNHHMMKPSESMHYATRTVTFQGENCSAVMSSPRKLFGCHEFAAYGQVLRTKRRSFIAT